MCTRSEPAAAEEAERLGTDREVFLAVQVEAVERTRSCNCAPHCFQKDC
jgi:hypothetical protein